MQCFVYGSNLDSDHARKCRGIVAFAVPDIGLSFKSGYIGTQTECEYMSLLTFLRFVEQNPKVFGGSRLDILSDAAAMVYQVSGRAPSTTLADKFMPTVKHFQKKLNFSVFWIPQKDNSAFEGIYHLPPLKSAPPINTRIADVPQPKKTPADLKRGRHFGI